MRSAFWVFVIAVVTGAGTEASADVAFTFEPMRGASYSGVHDVLGYRLPGSYVGVDAGFRWPNSSSPDEMRPPGALDLDLVFGRWIERGRWNALGGLELGAIDRYEDYGILNARSLGWTADAGVQAMVGCRLVRLAATDRATANFGLALGARAYVTADGEGIALLTVGILGWRASDRP